MTSPTITNPSKKAEINSPARKNFISSFQTSLRAAVSAGIALFVAQWLQLPYPFYAMISAVIVTDISPAGTRKLGVPRLAGTVLGAFLGATFSLLLPPTAWSIGIGIFAAMLLSYLLRFDQAAKISGYICAIVMLSFGDDPWTYAFYRLLETALGIGVAVAVSLIPKLLHSEVESE